MEDSKVRGEERGRKTVKRREEKRKGQREKIRDWWHIEGQIIFSHLLAVVIC